MKPDSGLWIRMKSIRTFDELHWIIPNIKFFPCKKIKDWKYCWFKLRVQSLSIYPTVKIQLSQNFSGNQLSMKLGYFVNPYNMLKVTGLQYIYIHLIYSKLKYINKYTSLNVWVWRVQGVQVSFIDAFFIIPIISYVGFHEISMLLKSWLNSECYW